MKIESNFILTCEQAFLTAGNNNLNCIGIFTQLNAEQFPFVFDRFTLVANFSTDALGPHVLTTRATDPDGKELFSSKLDVHVNADPFQVIAHFEHLAFSAPGVYEFTVLLDDERIGSRTITVRPVVHREASVA